ncbi:MAG TPA: ParB N-terminal domain-containing protein [Phycisphaerae bacterium]|nr:ParB N-terminal domain-containing protein [Phycisphaerae bacterium]
MIVRWIPLNRLEPHPENANRMAPALKGKLKRHIERTGRYEPLVVRPLGADPAGERYQILNGHHRAEVLRELGRTEARCDVWEVDDEEARMLLATLNRLEGRDDPSARARLVASLAAGRSAEDLARLLPEPADGVERLLRLAQPPPAPLAPEAVERPARPMTFFLTEEQHALVTEALRETSQCGMRSAECGVKNNSESAAEEKPAAQEGEQKRLTRNEALERLSLWYLESRNRR